MLIGNPDKFAFLIERVSEWETNSFINGLLYIFVNGKMYPHELRTTNLVGDLYELFDKQSPLMQLKIDDELFTLNSNVLFDKLCKITYPEEQENNYEYLIPFREISDSGYTLFIVCSTEKIKLMLGKENDGNIEFLDEVTLELAEFIEIREGLRKYYNDLLLRI